MFFCILKLQTLSFNFHEKITFLDNLPVIWYQYPPHKLVHNLIETFQMLFYGAQFSLQCIMGWFLFLTQNKLGDFMVCDKVEIWRYSMFCIWEDSSRKGYDCIIYVKLFLIVTCNKKVLSEVKQPGKVAFTAGQFARCPALNETSLQSVRTRMVTVD